VFELTPVNGGWQKKILYSFMCGRDGSGPRSTLAFDTAGNLYGTTEYGGDLLCNSGNGCGTMFKLKPHANGTWRKFVLNRFGAHPGAFPTSGVVLDTAGSIYGTTSGGGLTYGSVYEITP
jgi:uncharacterized repeat protein (TIGR03803 family)